VLQQLQQLQERQPPVLLACATLLQFLRFLQVLPSYSPLLKAALVEPDYSATLGESSIGNRVPTI
jgi:hypothetical protein